MAGKGAAGLPATAARNGRWGGRGRRRRQRARGGRAARRESASAARRRREGSGHQHFDARRVTRAQRPTGGGKGEGREWGKEGERKCAPSCAPRARTAATPTRRSLRQRRWQGAGATAVVARRRQSRVPPGGATALATQPPRALGPGRRGGAGGAAAKAGRARLEGGGAALLWQLKQQSRGVGVAEGGSVCAWGGGPGRGVSPGLRRRWGAPPHAPKAQKASPWGGVWQFNWGGAKSFFLRLAAAPTAGPRGPGPTHARASASWSTIPAATPLGEGGGVVGAPRGISSNPVAGPSKEEKTAGTAVDSMGGGGGCTRTLWPGWGLHLGRERAPHSSPEWEVVRRVQGPRCAWTAGRGLSGGGGEFREPADSTDAAVDSPAGPGIQVQSGRVRCNGHTTVQCVLCTLPILPWWPHGS